MITTVLAWPIPLIVGFDVIPSLAELPVSDTSAMLTTGVGYRRAEDRAALHDRHDGIGLAGALDRGVRSDPVACRTAGVRYQRDANHGFLLVKATTRVPLSRIGGCGRCRRYFGHLSCSI